MIEAIIGLLSSPAAIGVAGSVVGFAKGIKFIQEGQAGVVLRFGKAKRDKRKHTVATRTGAKGQEVLRIGSSNRIPAVETKVSD
jgi:regulator of protease activity HflC (stomatin/prohibitin superfamily)